MIDVELDEPDAETWMRSFTDIRLALATRLEVEEGDEDYWHALPDDDPRAPGARHLRVGRLPPGDAGRGAATRLTHCGAWTDPRRGRSLRLERVLTIDQATYDAIVAHAKRDHPDEACGVVAGPEGSDRPERFVEMVNAAGSPTFYEFDSTDLLPALQGDGRERRGAGGRLPLAHRHRGLPEPHRHRPGDASRTRTTCWSAPASTGITRARSSSGPTGSSTAR